MSASWSLDSDYIRQDPLFTATDPNEEKLIYFYNPVESLLQIGPTCGLVCLIQAKRFIQPDSEALDVDTLLDEARRMGLTNHGEMFSASGVELLARDVLELNATTWTCLESNRNSIIESLLDDAALLIPYDSGWLNDEPVLLKGKRAHWCICTGFGFRIRLNELSNRMLDELEESEDEPFVDLKSIDFSTRDLLRLLDRSTDLSLFCKQGRSSFQKVFNFERLMLSNKNLLYVADWVETGSYVVPEEGIGQSLCNKLVVIT